METYDTLHEIVSDSLLTVKEVLSLFSIVSDI